MSTDSLTNIVSRIRSTAIGAQTAHGLGRTNEVTQRLDAIVAMSNDVQRGIVEESEQSVADRADAIDLATEMMRHMRDIHVAAEAGNLGEVMAIIQSCLGVQRPANENGREAS
jgi:hypothetical protein